MLRIRVRLPLQTLVLASDTHTNTQTLSCALFLILRTLSARKKNSKLRGAVYLEILNTTTAWPNFSTRFGHLILSSALPYFLHALQMPGQLLGQGLAAQIQTCMEAMGTLVCPLVILPSEVCSSKRQTGHQIALSSLTVIFSRLFWSLQLFRADATNWPESVGTHQWGNSEAQVQTKTGTICNSCAQLCFKEGEVCSDKLAYTYPWTQHKVTWQWSVTVDSRDQSLLPLSHALLPAKAGFALKWKHLTQLCCLFKFYLSQKTTVCIKEKIFLPLIPLGFSMPNNLHLFHSNFHLFSCFLVGCRVTGL